MSEVMDDALAGLKKARAEQAEIARRASEVAAREQARLRQLDETLAKLNDDVLVVDSVHDLVGLGILEASERLLREHPEGLPTQVIGKEILRRGVKTTSKRYTPTVYATLNKSRKFVREGDGVEAVWKLKEAR